MFNGSLRMRNIIILALGVSLLVFAVNRYTAAKRQMQSHQWTLHEERIGLIPAERISVELRPDASADYLIAAKFVSSSVDQPSEQFLCDIGWSFGDDAVCVNKEIELSVDWLVRDASGLVVARADVAPRAGTLGSRHGTVYLGKFPARAGALYRLEATTKRSSARLRSYEPTLVVRIDPMRFKNAVASSQMKAVIAIVASVVGGGLLVLVGFLSWRQRR